MAQPKNTLADLNPISPTNYITVTVPGTTKTEILVREIPKMTVDTGTDVVAVSSFVITALIILATTWMTVRSAKKTYDFQEKEAQATQEVERTKTRVEVLSKNRQNWIDNLRDSLAEYIGHMLEIVELRAAWDASEQRLHDTPDVHTTAIIEHNYKLQQARFQCARLQAKINLLANPKESDFINLKAAIERLRRVVDEGNRTVSNEVDAVIEISQKILGAEWKKVKDTV